jgi:hypothetical protein
MFYVAMNRASKVFIVTGETKEELKLLVQERLGMGFNPEDTTSTDIKDIMSHAKEAELCPECGMDDLKFYTLYDERGIPAGRALECIKDKCEISEDAKKWRPWPAK